MIEKYPFSTRCALHLSLALTFGLFCYSPPVNAEVENGGTFYYTIGSHFLNPDQVSPILVKAGYPEIGGLHWNQGGGVYGVFKRFFLGWEGSRFLGSSAKSTENQLNLSGGYGMFQLGYVVLSTPLLQIYPYLGLGQGGMEIRATQTLNQILTVKQGDLPLTSLEGKSWLFEAGLGGNFILPVAKEPQGLSVGWRSGYIFSPLGFEWSSNQLPVQGGPRFTPEGFYLRLTLGYSGYQ